ncbi:hypothetical protein HMPREF1544_12020 [Mucor circinelloides 1006PhL]|uniref:Cyclin N-terminal domain-containing protein n=1 Tax=Mucor circinelloides f. circinelloides (strain 1006PhL) TaxID=1220926 RepID=S2IUD9_MUCC1|nr:hypothetical protein HMPREF1544_12071 [Mucor circinelloides 1006PhL]EPB81276.1 hypothetical protein HMPREF1544_12020 [Mucor circinelloides 1006PhL]
MLLTIENAVPAMESALSQILPDHAKHLMLNMISAWIISSRITLNNNSINDNKLQHQSNSNKTTLRSWATRSFSLKPKPIVTPMQQLTEIPDKIQEQQALSSSPPSLVNSSKSTLSSNEQDDDDSLYTPLINDAADAPTSATASKQPFSQLPVSLKSMIDLLDTPPLIPDTSTLSLIEESLTPLTSTFFEGQGHLAVDSSSVAVGESNNTFKTASDIHHSNSAIATIASSRDTRSIGNSISTIFTQLGNSVKKAFKKKAQSSSISQLKKTFSVQHHLSLNKEQTSSFTPPNEKAAHRSFSSLASITLDQKKQDQQSASISSPVVKKEHVYGNCNEAAANSLTTISSQDIDDIQFMPSHDSFSRAVNSSYWDGDSTQSEQFDRLLDDIWERSQEYQDYFTAQEKNKENELLSNRVSKQAYPYLDYKHELWSPSMDDALKSSTAVVRPSRTEGNMNGMQDSIPYVCVGNKQQPNQRTSHIPRPVHKKLLLDIEDVKAYKKSTSVYSNIKDYDIEWQQSFHEAQKSRDKVANTLKSVSWAFYSIIKRNHSLHAFECDVIFDENESNMEDFEPYSQDEPLTEWNDVYDQLAYVFDCGELTAEHAIITFIYVKRMLELSKQNLWDFSWRMIIMSALLTAVKVWDDCAIFNADFAMIFPELSLDVINNIERVFLTYLQWDVSVNCSEFAKTYFHLRDIEHMMEQW